MLKTLSNLLKQDKEKYRVPRRVQDVIPIKRIWNDGIFLVGNKYTKSFCFTDINYLVASRPDKESFFLNYSELLNSLDAGSTTKITVNNRPLNRATFEKSILMPLRKDRRDRYRKEYNKMLMDKGTGANCIRIPLGYIPCGTTNDFAASHGISADILKAARQAAYGKETVYDIGCFENQYFSYVALFGAFSWMAYTTDQDLKNRIGYTAYLLDAAKDLNRNQPHHLRVTANGVTYEDDYIFGAVSNAKKLAGIIELPEGLVDTNDGRLEVFLVKAPKSLLDWDTILRGVVARDFSSPFFELTQAEEIWIDNEPGLTWSLDGECSGEMDRIHIVPKLNFMHLKT